MSTPDWNDVRVSVAEIRGMVTAGQPVDGEDVTMMLGLIEMLLAHIKHLQGGSATILTREAAEGGT